MNLETTDEEFQNGALTFFKNQVEIYTDEHPVCMENDALDYVKKVRPFRYHDVVEAGVLIGVLEKLGYVRYLKKEKNMRYHQITEEGLFYLSQY